MVPDPPGPSSATVALSVKDASGERGTSGISALEQFAPYVVHTRCQSDTRGTTLGYTASIDGVAVVSGQVPCDGSVHVDSAFEGSGERATYSVDLRDTRGSVRAYAAIVQAPTSGDPGAAVAAPATR